MYSHPPSQTSLSTAAMTNNHLPSQTSLSTAAMINQIGAPGSTILCPHT